MKAGQMSEPYSMGGWEIIWLAEHADLPPEDFVRRYLRVRTRRLGSDGERRPAVRLRQLIDRNWAHLQNYSRCAKQSLAPPGSAPQAPFDLYRSFRDYWRGYTDEQFAHEVTRTTSKLRRLRRDASLALQRAQRKLLIATKRKQEGRSTTFKDLVDRLTSLLDDINNTDAAGVCKDRLYRQAFDRGPGLNIDPIDHLDLRLLLNSPARADMPLRFLVRESLGIWHELQTAWANRLPRKDLLAIVEKQLNPQDVLSEIRKHDAAMVGKGYKGRANALHELETTWRNGAYLACALLATTQAEGCIWDLATMMNKKGWRIFRTERDASGRKQRYAYLWDRAMGRYKRDAKGKIAVDGRPLTSARVLLAKTRLSTLFHIEVFSYLVDEYYDVRNSLAHGDTAQRPIREDSFAALLCIRAIYQQILDTR